MCSVKSCDRPVDDAGFCHAHYMRIWYTGDVRESVPLVERGIYVEDEQGRIQCTKCERMLPPSRYGVNRNNARGLSRHCKDCEIVRKRAIKEANPEKWAGQAIARYHVRRARRMQNGPVDDIALDDLRARLGDACAYCGTAMSFELMRTYDPTRASIEHVIPLARGGTHSFDNVVLACMACNLSKNSRLLDEWEVAA